jgi:restriction system protein
MAAEGSAGGFVVTGGQFTADAREFAGRAGIELIDGAALEELIGREAASASTAATETSVQSTPACPRCGTVMVRRVAKQGKHLGRAFWGCGQYPKCSGIVQIS